MRAVGRIKIFGGAKALAVLGLALCAPAAIAQQVVSPTGLTDPLGGNWSPVSGPVPSLGIDANGRWRVLTLDANGYLKIDCVTGCSGSSGGGSNAAAGTVNGTAPASTSSTGFTNSSGNLVAVTPSAPLPTGDALAEAALGTPADIAWGGTGSGSTVALLKATIAALLANTAVNSSYSTVVSNPTVGGSSVTAGRGIMMYCTVAGNVVLVLSNGGSLNYPVVAAPSVAIQPLAVVSVTSETATCTFTNLN